MFRRFRDSTSGAESSAKTNDSTNEKPDRRRSRRSFSSWFRPSQSADDVKVAVATGSGGSDGNLNRTGFSTGALPDDTNASEETSIDTLRSEARSKLEGGTAKLRMPSSEDDADMEHLKKLLGDLDLTRLTDRLFVSGMLWKHRTEKRSHRNNVHDLAAFLNGRFRRTYLIFDLSGHAVPSYDTAPFLNQVVSFPPPPKHPVHTLEQLLAISHMIALNLHLSPNTVTLLHCSNGRVRSGLVTACYLRRSGLFSSADDAFEYFIERRARGERQWISVTQKRYLRYFDEIMERMPIHSTPPRYVHNHVA